ncbi:ABC transporter substrate-binding protein, partial [Klebsiella pneumoniae]|uniref:ABC transporter substrate-binding protein n=1 Tax=Klebsiella pneumoniae TaxID=573 RepID=UPI002764C210|nr:ABC transporter substrate-binding protein [Klebsiella pneumoniae]
DDGKDYPYDPEKAPPLRKDAGRDKGFTLARWAMPVQRPYTPNARRRAAMSQADWAQSGVQAQSVTSEGGASLQRANAGAHPRVRRGWTGETGAPENVVAPRVSG